MKINELLEAPLSAQTRDDIVKLLGYHFIVKGTYSINNDLTVDVNGGIELIKDIKVSKLPVKFRKVTKYFDCANNELTTLQGSPLDTYNFYCHYNKLTNLIGGPIKMSYRRRNNYSDYWCGGNPLTSLEGAPKTVEVFDCSSNTLTSLNGLPDTIEIFSLTWHPTLPLLKLFYINNLKEFNFRNNDSSDQKEANSIKYILGKYMGQGRKGIILCAAELTRAGYKGNAQL